MPSIPSNTSSPSFGGPTHISTQPQPKVAPPHFGAVTASDSIHFGTKKDKKTTQEHDGDEQKGGLRLWDRTKASLKGAFNGLLVKGWHWDIGTSLGIFFLTLPLALLIPGSHFVLIPGYIGLARGIRGVSGLSKGLFSPDKILHPEGEDKKAKKKK